MSPFIELPRRDGSDWVNVDAIDAVVTEMAYDHLNDDIATERKPACALWIRGGRTVHTRLSVDEVVDLLKRAKS